MGLDVLRSIQSVHTPALDAAAQCVTMLGESVVLSVIFLFIFWTVDREKGEYIALCLMTSLFFGNAIKALVMRPRPISQPGIRSLRTQTATGSSFPSVHTQNAASAYGALALLFKKPALTAACIAVTLLVGLSRLYLGVHWPGDVLAGLAIGALIPCALYALEYYNIIDKHSAFAIVAIACVIGALICRQEDMVKSAGLALGAAISTRVNRRLRFGAGSSRIRLAARCAIGLALVAAVYFGGGAVLPDTLFAAFARYLLVAVTAMLLCPRLFVKLSL